MPKPVTATPMFVVPEEGAAREHRHVRTKLIMVTVEAAAVAREAAVQLSCTIGSSCVAGWLARYFNRSALATPRGGEPGLQRAATVTDG